MFFKNFFKKSRNESVAYHLCINQYKETVDHVTGPPQFSGLLVSKDGAIQIPSDATWPQVRQILWKQIINRFYGVVQESTRQDFDLGFGINYMVQGHPKTYCCTGSGRSYNDLFALLHRKDIKIVKLDVSFAPFSKTQKDDDSQTSTKHLPKVRMDEKA